MHYAFKTLHYKYILTEINVSDNAHSYIQIDHWIHNHQCEFIISFLS